MPPKRTVSAEAVMMAGLRPTESAVNEAMAAPTGAPMLMRKEYLKELAMLRPCWTKKVGSQVTKPKIKVLATMRTVAPTKRREKSCGPKREAKLLAAVEGGAEAGAGSGGS